MRERINKLSKGIVDTETPILLVQSETIEDSVRAGEITKKEIFVTSENNLHLKGLVYSSNARVCLGSGVFGGSRNHISFDVNSRHMDYGERIDGAFYLVTNGGEKEIPYSFHVEAEDTGKVLTGLKTPMDFANLAREDFDLAFRLFEYQNFIEVPFMQDLHIRSLYDGLKGHGSRRAALESFLIALGQKRPVRIVVAEKTKLYKDVKEPISDTIEIKKDGWGYCPVTVNTDGEFIRILQKVISNSDLQEDTYEFSYQILPSELHGGRNFGSITFHTMTQSVTIPIKATRYCEKKNQVVNRINYGRYFNLRLDYESHVFESGLLQNQMLEEIERLKQKYRSDALLSLLEAELYVLMEQKDKANEVLQECRQRVFDIRQERTDLYCLMQYIALLADPDKEKQITLIHLLHKYEEDAASPFFFYMLLKRVEGSERENPIDSLTKMRDLYLAGCHSPFLYLQSLQLFNQSPELVYSMDSYEIQVLYFGAKRGMVEETLALKVAKLAGVMKHYNRIYFKLLSILYERYPEKEILGAICGMLIRGERRSPADFLWYEKALKQQISLTRLYEYYLYSLPVDYKQPIPKEVLLYFSYDHELDRQSKAVLYKNILMFTKPETPLYREYEKRIGTFATEQIFESRIDSNLAVIYQHMIYRDMIDLPVSKVLPAILKSYRISCDNKEMKYVVVCYEELTEEGVYPLENGVAYVPIFSKQSQILFQDIYGNRHSNISCLKILAMNQPELEKRCFEVYPEHPMLLLKASREKLEKEKLSAEDIALLERVLMHLRLHPLYKKTLASRIIEYYRQSLVEETEEDAPARSGYLLALDQNTLSRQQRADLCETFICQNYIKEAYEIMKEYGYEDISTKRLLKLCTKMILQKLFDQDELLLKLAYRVFEDGKSDGVILDYLCEFFNGTTDQMYRILSRATAEHVETYDMEERLLAQMLFSGNTEKIDQVFALYTGQKKTSESMVKAYFTMKSYEYFMHDIPMNDQTAAYLEGMINGTIEKDKIATIHLLALTKYYSTLPGLEKEQISLCQNLIYILLEEGMVFPYFKKLAKYIFIPGDILDKEIIQYMGQRNSEVELRIRILPDEELYHSDVMKRVYQGIFIKQKILFEGEILDYQIYEQKGDTRCLMAEGKIACELPEIGAGSSRYDCLNQMSFCLSLKDEDGLKRTMRDYLQKTASIETLFTLM